MDYLRQQIEASLGRSEELLISDKARHTFYRYPPDPGPSSKKVSKERGTFNSVRLKKYLGLGSSKRSKQLTKVDEDELHQQLQQHAYLEELQRYGSPAVPAGNTLYYDGAGQMALYPTRAHQATVCLNGPSPWNGTVTGSHYPNGLYSSVNVRSVHHHQRGALQKALCAWEPYYGQPSDQVLQLSSNCTCVEDSLSKSHVSQASGSSSKGRQIKQSSSRPSFSSASGGRGVDHVRHNLHSSGSYVSSTTGSGSNLYVEMPSPQRQSSSVKQFSKRMTGDVIGSDPFQRPIPIDQKRRSILECPVNPYELMGKQQRSRRRSAPPRITIDGEDNYVDRHKLHDMANGNCNSYSPVKYTSKENYDRFKSSKAMEGDSNADCVTNISLGGQRIRLFETVRGTMSVRGSSSSTNRPPLPSFVDLNPVTHPKSPALTRSNPNANATKNGFLKHTQPVTFRLKEDNRISHSRMKEDWCAPIKLNSELPKHKTTINIGRSISEEQILTSIPKSTDFQSFPDAKSYSCDDVADTTTACHTVIAIGQNTSVIPARHGRLNLKINLSELSAYLKPILKKAGLSESSSEADNSESTVDRSNTSVFMELPVTETSRHKQKKHVHFLSNRTSTGSESSLLVSPLALEGADQSDDSDSSISSTRDLYDDVMYVANRDCDNLVNSSTNVSSEEYERKSPDHERIFAKQITTVKLDRKNTNDDRDTKLKNTLDSKYSSLRRSQSERQVGSEDQTSSSSENSKSRLTPTRSKSFQFFPSPLSNSNLKSSEDSDLSSYGSNNQNNKLSTDFCGTNNLNCPMGDDGLKKSYIGKDIIRGQSLVAFESNFEENNQSNSSGTLDIGKLRALPKFLPRPYYRGKLHASASSSTSTVPVVEDLSLSSVEDISENSREDTLDSDWGLQSEEDIYADGTSSLLATSFNHKPLPNRPTDIREQYSSSSDEINSSDDSMAIYEQIREPVEPLYEEVPDTISYTSASSVGSGQPRKSIFEGASRTEILNYLEDAKERGLESIDSESANDDGISGGDGGNDSLSRSDSGDRQPDDDDVDDVDDELEEQSEHVTGLNQNISAKRNHRNRISNLSNLSDSSQTSEESFQNDDPKETKDRHSHSCAEVERNDSGVGSETSKPSRLRRQSRLGSSEQICVDCDQNLEPIYDTESDTSLDQLVCRKCSKKRSERKEIILEIVETEIKYGRDLKIIKEEFHRPMLVAGLLSEDLLSNIFLNLDQLVEVNDLFAEKLKDALEIAAEQGDEDYSTVNVGKVFQDSSAMLHAFEAYCVRQGTASLMLSNLEKEKELLRIFLKVSQMENTLLRRLNLNSFLMVPVQRVTKYPLLLNRLYKVTPHHHQDRESLREAQLKIELHLEHINQQAKDLSGMNLWRRISNISNSQRKNILEPVLGNVKLRKMALQILQWNSEDARFALEGRLLYAAVTDNVWNKREKTLKLIPIHGLLITLGTPNANYRPDLADRDDQSFPRNTGIKETSLVLIKEKGSRFSLLREPLPLQRCVLSSEIDTEDIFEIQELTTKDAYILKAEDPKDTSEWLRLLRYHAKDLGAWRRRRNALANIMINGMVARREWL